jgi:hypothetical protein
MVGCVPAGLGDSASSLPAGKFTAQKFCRGHQPRGGFSWLVHLCHGPSSYMLEAHVIIDI